MFQSKLPFPLELVKMTKNGVSERARHQHHGGALAIFFIKKKSFSALFSLDVLEILQDNVFIISNLKSKFPVLQLDSRLGCIFLVILFIPLLYIQPSAAWLI